jgi:lipopolysaccharide export system protein LptA
MKTDQITLTGGVVVTRGLNVIKGDTLIIEVSTGKTTISSNTGPGGKPKTERVRGVFQPSSGPSSGSPAPATGAAPKPAPAGG